MKFNNELCYFVPWLLAIRKYDGPGNYRDKSRNQYSVIEMDEDDDDSGFVIHSFQTILRLQC